MALTEETVEDKIEVVGDYKSVQIRTATIIKRDGEEISRAFHRHVLQPSDKGTGVWVPTDISGESAEVQAICNGVWTDAVRSAYEAYMDTQIDENNP